MRLLDQYGNPWANQLVTDLKVRVSNSTQTIVNLVGSVTTDASGYVIYDVTGIPVGTWQMRAWADTNADGTIQSTEPQSGVLNYTSTS
jgi:hypothetical protein